MMEPKTKLSTEPLRAQSYEEIKPLIELCKTGHLFEVQKWIDEGKPLNLPLLPGKANRCKTPLEVSLANGFHSLAQVLLEGGAAQESIGWRSPMCRALEMRRVDFIKLLVEHGYDPRTIEMEDVFHTWDPEIMEYFIDQGADVETGNPLAYALCNRIRTALRVFKRYKDRFDSFPEQANIALRFHCKEGNKKWISLMLWAGADPYTPGNDDYEYDLEPDEEPLSALGYAADWGHFEIFGMKKVALNLDHPDLHKVLSNCHHEEGMKIAVKLLKKGLNPNNQENGGSSAIQNLLLSLGMTFYYSPYEEVVSKALDTEESRAKIKAIHVLAKYGAKWVPQDNNEMNTARRGLLTLTPDYTVEFVWIMSKYQSCSRETIEWLLRTPTIKRHTKEHNERLNELVQLLEAEVISN